MGIVKAGLWQLQGDLEPGLCVCVSLVSWAMCLAEEKFQLGRAWKLSIYPASCYIERANARTEMQNCYVWLLLSTEIASN